MRSRRQFSGSAVLTIAAALVAALPVVAQQALDRTRVPAAGKTPVLRVPVWTRASLGNGVELVVSEKHDLPLVSFSITFLGGADQYEKADRRGLAAVTAAMMSEGTATRDGEALSNALQLLGGTISTNIGSESGSMSFVSAAGKFPQTLDILADMLLHSTFPADALERIRQQRLVALAQSRAQPGSIASRVFPRVLYGQAHPFGQPVTEESLKAITRDDVTAFHQAYFRPGRALISVVGDVQAATVRATVEKALAPWSAGGDKPSFSYPKRRRPSPTTIYIVDKPGAAQSTFAIGIPGPSAEYAGLLCAPGHEHDSRRPVPVAPERQYPGGEGYSYGVSSSFAYGKGHGPFRAGGDVVSDKTDAALVEFMKELKGIVGSRPVTDEELTTAKDALVQRLPAAFASVASVNGAITSLWVQGLPEDYYQQYPKSVGAVTKEDVLRVAKKYVDVDHLAIVIVGDRASIEEPLKATAIAPIAVLDDYGNPKASQ